MLASGMPEGENPSKILAKRENTEGILDGTASGEGYIKERVVYCDIADSDQRELGFPAQENSSLGLHPEGRGRGY